MNAPLKVVHVQLLPLLSGVQKVTLDELTHLDRSVYASLAICQSEGPFTAALRAIDVPVRLVPELDRAIDPVRDLKALIALYRIFRRERPAVVHTHSSKTGFLGRFAAWFARVPLIVHTVHGFAFDGAPTARSRKLYRAIEWISAKVTDRLIVLNESDERIALTQLHVPRRRLVSLVNGVDTEVYAPETRPPVRRDLRRSLLGLGDDQVLAVALIGRLWEQKNPMCFVEAAIRVLDSGRSAAFFLVGDGEYRAQIESAIAASGHRAHVRILGWRDDIPALLKALDVVVLPSRWEGMPMALLEAMSAAVAVVASDIPGNHHLIEDRVDGLLFPVDDVDALARALSDLIDQPEIRAELARNARVAVHRRYTLDARMARITELYSSAQSTRGRRRLRAT